ncbi:ATP-binding protein [bacterium]|nr:ATP-binding protein [bacterium]
MFNKKCNLLFISSNPQEIKTAGESLSAPDCDVYTVSSAAELRSTQPLMSGSQLALISLTHPDLEELSAYFSEISLDAEFLFIFSPDSHGEDGDTHPADAVFRKAAQKCLPRICCLGYTNLPSVKQACRIMDSLGSWWEIKAKDVSVHERYRKFLNRVNQGIVDTDENAKIRWANNTFKVLAGTKDVIGRRLDDFIDPRDLPCMAAVQVQLHNGIISPFRVRLRADSLPVEIDATPRFDRDSVFKGIVSLVTPADKLPMEEFFASRNLSYLYSLALRLSQAFDISKVINIITESVREMCGFACCGIKLQGCGEVIDRTSEHVVTASLKKVIDSFCLDLGKQSIKVIKDVGSQPDPTSLALKEAGFKGIACVALTVGTEHIGYIWALSDSENAISRENNSFLISVGIQAGLALQNAINVRRRLEEETGRRRFYRDALNALTAGKLVFCERDELDSHWADCGRELISLKLESAENVPDSRHLTEKVMKEEGFEDEIVFNMVTCVSEAATNVVKYGPPGKMAIKTDSEGIHVRLDDTGPGISFATLPKAILLPGFSCDTAPSLGLGYSVMLSMCDRIYLCTGQNGTSLILEIMNAKDEADPLDAFIGFAELAEKI